MPFINGIAATPADDGRIAIVLTGEPTTFYHLAGAPIDPDHRLSLSGSRALVVPELTAVAFRYVYEVGAGIWELLWVGGANDASNIPWNAEVIDWFNSTNVDGVIDEIGVWLDANESAIGTHIADASAAHAASAISILDAAADFTATDVEGALAELQADAEAHAAAGDPHPTYETSAEAAAKITAHEAAANPHPTYETAAEAAAQIATHAAAANPHPTYETAAEALAQIATHAGLADPHTVYVLEAAVPGGELGGTYATPTVDASHAGGTHAATQAAAEATAAAALAAHVALGDSSASNLFMYANFQ
jgi:hypothetical protein